ncbi:MAG: YSC84-related protein [Verrucomicrobiota bacterium]
MKLKRIFAELVLVVLALTILPAGSVAASAARIDADSRVALNQLYAVSPAARHLGHRARAVLVFPHIVKAGFLFGGQYGDGALISGGKTIGFYNTAAASYGLQAGVQKFSFAMFFMDDRALSYLRRSQGWAIGTDPNIVIVDVGAGEALTTTSLHRGIYTFFFNQKGLMAGLTLQGSKITPIHPRR